MQALVQNFSHVKTVEAILLSFSSYLQDGCYGPEYLNKTGKEEETVGQPHLIPFNKVTDVISETAPHPRRCTPADLLGQKLCHVSFAGRRERWESQHVAGYKVLQVRAQEQGGGVGNR